MLGNGVGEGTSDTALYALISPNPYESSTPPFPKSVAVDLSMVAIAGGFRLGFAWSISATKPATCGAAMDVPLIAV